MHSDQLYDAFMNASDFKLDKDWMRRGSYSRTIGLPLKLDNYRNYHSILGMCGEADRLLEADAATFEGLHYPIDQLVAQLALDGRIDLSLGSQFPVQPEIGGRSLSRIFAQKLPRQEFAGLVSKIKNSSLALADLLHLQNVGTGQSKFRCHDGWIIPWSDNVVTIFPHTDYGSRLEELCRWINNNLPLPITLQALVAFFQIGQLHAFENGNGRLARALCNAILCARLFGSKAAALPLAPVIYANTPQLVYAFRRYNGDAKFEQLFPIMLALVRKAAHVSAIMMRAMKASEQIAV